MMHDTSVEFPLSSGERAASCAQQTYGHARALSMGARPLPTHVWHMAHGTQTTYEENTKYETAITFHSWSRISDPVTYSTSVDLCEKCPLPPKTGNLQRNRISEIPIKNRIF